MHKAILCAEHRSAAAPEQRTMDKSKGNRNQVSGVRKKTTTQPHNVCKHFYLFSLRKGFNLCLSEFLFLIEFKFWLRQARTNGQEGIKVSEKTGRRSVDINARVAVVECRVCCVRRSHKGNRFSLFLFDCKIFALVFVKVFISKFIEL